MTPDGPPDRSDGSRRHFTSADLQRQLDIAIDLLVFQIEQISSSATSDEGSTRGADDWRLPPTLELLRERDPNAIVVLEAINSRLFERERGWGLLH
jgi:DNA-binding transcriptional MerR regulator